MVRGLQVMKMIMVNMMRMLIMGNVAIGLSDGYDDGAWPSRPTVRHAANQLTICLFSITSGAVWTLVGKHWTEVLTVALLK